MTVTMITKNDCPQCQRLKMFLQLALNNKYQNDIKIVNKETDQEEYVALTEKHQILTLPVMISGDEVLTKTDPSAIVTFLEKYVGKK